MSTAIYVRQSQDRSGEELGITRQLEDCRALAAQRGWPPATEFVENDTPASGRVARPRFDDLLDRVKSGRVKVIIAWNMYRLLRTPRDRLRLIEIGQRAGLTVAFARGPDLDLTTPAGRLIAGVLGEVAQAEIAEKSDRQRRAARQAARLGRRHGGRRAIGYELDGMTVIPAEAAAVRDGYAAVLAGEGLASIARRWDRAGLRRTQTDAGWTHDAVRLVLTNPRYAGLRRHVTAELRERPGRVQPDEGIVGPAAWPALVSEETWRATLGVLSDPARRRGTPGARQLLTGLAVCGVGDCGLLVHGGGASRRTPGYRCRSDRHLSRQAAPVDEYVTEMVCRRLARPDAARLLAPSPTVDLAGLQVQAVALRERITATRRQFAASDVMSPADLHEVLVEMRTRLSAIEAQMSDAGRVDVLGPLLADSEAEVRRRWDALLVDGSRDRQRAVVAMVCSVRLFGPGRGYRIFDPDTVEVAFHA